MSPVGDKEGSLTRRFMLAKFPTAVPGLPRPATLVDAQRALDSAMVTACRHHDAAAPLLVWCALS